MKLTIEMDPTADKDVFDRVMAALTGAAQTTNKASTAEAPVETPGVTTPDEKPDETPSDEKSDEEGFKLDEEDEMSPEEFRGKVIALNKEHGKAAIAVLSEYGSGLSKIPKEKYKEVLSRLQDLGNA